MRVARGEWSFAPVSFADGVGLVPGRVVVRSWSVQLEFDSG